MASSPNPRHAQVSMDILKMLQPAAEKLGINLPGLSRFAPVINVGLNIRSLALEIGRLVSKQDIFIKPAGLIVTVDKVTGEESPMSPRRFPDWAEQFCEFVSPGSRRVRESLSVDDAAQILETDTFKGCLRPLTAVHTVRLPVMRPGIWPEDGGLKPAGGPALGTVEFLEEGYDAASGIFTVDTLPYPMDWLVDRSVEFLEDVAGEMPWVRNDTEGRLRTNRNFSVWVMLLVGTYCRALFPVGTLRPMGGVFANKSGSGKTRLVEALLAHVHGFVAATGAPKDEEKMEVKLETIAQSMQPFAIFDDIGGSLRSNALNRFITESMHGGRKFHSNSEFFTVPNVTQVFVTANELPGGTSEDLDRRALIMELFLEEEVRGRKFRRVITPAWLAAPETRAQFLAACCALLKNWLLDEDWGTLGQGPMPLHRAPLETFDDWTSVMGGIVMAAGFADPLTPPDRIVGGSAQEDEIKQLLIAVASAVVATAPEGSLLDGTLREPVLPSLQHPLMLERKQLVATARKHGLLDDLVGSEGDEELDATMNKRFGKRMQRWRGQKLMDEHGRPFQFSHKRKKAGATYPLSFL